MTSILITPEIVVTDQKVIISEGTGRRVVYKDKLLVPENKQFVIVGTGEMDMDLTGKKLNELTDEVRLFLNFEQIVSKINTTKMEIIDRDEDPEVGVIETMAKEISKVESYLTPLVNNFLNHFSVKVRENLTYTPSILFIITKNITIIMGDTDELKDFDEKHIVSDISVSSISIKLDMDGGKTIFTFDNSYIKHICHGSGTNPLMTAMRLSKDRSPIKAMQFACHVDSFSSYRGDKPPHIYLEDLKPIRRFNKKEFTNLYKEYK